MATYTKKPEYQSNSSSYSQADKPLDIKDLPVSRAAAKKYGFDDTQLALILAVCPNTAKDVEVASFLYQAARTKLDPLGRQLYLVSRSGKATVQTSIDGFRLVADRTGQYIGSDDPVFDEGLSQYAWAQTGREFPTTATVTVYKAIGSHVGKFSATAAWEAYYPGERQGYMWIKMKLLMLSKVAESLALRKAFPMELSGIYTSEEMMQAGEAENDVGVSDLVQDLGVLNQHALAVLEKLDEIQIAEDDPRIVAAIGYTVKTVPNTAEGSDLLKKIWTAATAIKKGAAVEDALAATQ